MAPQHTRRTQHPARFLWAAIALLLAADVVALVTIDSGGKVQAAEPSSTSVPSSTTTTVPLPVAPLTGLAGDHGDRLDRPAAVVKIDNVAKAHPQAGINQADVVYEERVEGSVTRLLAVFHSTDAAPVGPVRSARTSDIGIFTPLHRPYFAWSGANKTFAAAIRRSAVFDAGFDAATRHYHRAGNRPGPHDLMLESTADLLAIPSEGSAPPPALFAYRAEGTPVVGAEPVIGVHVSYGSGGGAAPVEYRWDGTGWARTQSGAPHVDTEGVQVAPANVIVQFTPYASSGVNDQFGQPIPEAQTVGSGEAWVLTDGGLVVGTWHKPSLEAVTTYLDAAGQPIALTPGRTWVALTPPGGATRL